MTRVNTCQKKKNVFLKVFLLMLVASALMFNSPIILIGVVYMLIRISRNPIVLISIYIPLQLIFSNILRAFSLEINEFVSFFSIIFSVFAALFITNNYFKNDMFLPIISWKFFDALLILMLSLFIFLISLGRNSIFHSLTNLGYDNVGHFAILQKLSSCTNFISECDSLSKSLPESYQNYPQQWHILYSNFFSSGTSEWALTQYLFLIMFSTFISIIVLINVSLYVANLLKKYSKDLPISRFFQYNISLLILTLVLIITFYGYPNFVFSLTFFFLGMIFLLGNSSKESLVGSIAMLICVGAYTLFLIPCFVVAVLLFSRGSQTILKSLWLINATFWVYFVSITVISSVDNGNFSYLNYGGTYLSIVIFVELIHSFVVIILIRELFLDRKNLIKISYLLKFTLTNVIVLFCLFGLHFIIIISGNTRSYYLGKFIYLNLFLIIFSITIILNSIKLIKYASIRSELIVFIILLVWTVSPSFVIRSPYITFIKLVKPISSERNTEIDRIFNAAMIGKDSDRPVFLLSNNIGSDAHWINALAGTWSQDLQQYLIDGYVISEKFTPFSINELQKNGFIVLRYSEGIK
jgi:hypothetical protein